MKLQQSYKEQTRQTQRITLPVRTHAQNTGYYYQTSYKQLGMAYTHLHEFTHGLVCTD